MANKKILFLTLICGVVLFLAGSYNAYADCAGCMQDCNNNNINADVPTDCDAQCLTQCATSATSSNPCFNKTNGFSCTADGGGAGSCYGEICIRCGQAGDSCEDNCCSGLECVSSQCVSATSTPGATPQTPVATPGANPNNSSVQPSGTGIVIPTGTGLPDPSGGIAQIVRNLLTWLLGIVGVIAIIGFVISGIQYLTSAGDEDRMKSAKRNMLYAIIGVVVVLSSYVIIQAIQYALEAKSMF